MSQSGFLSELKRRHVFRAAAFYAAAAFVVLQAADLMLPALHLPGWTFTFLVVLALLGLPVVLALAWALAVGRDGVRLAEPAASRPARIGFAAIAAAALAAGGWVALGGDGTFEAAGEGDLGRMVVSEVLPPTSHRFTGFPVLSPDGGRMLFGAVDPDGRESLWIRPLDGLEATAVPGTEDAGAPFWSPDGKSIAFFADAALWRLDLDGGARTRLCDAPSWRGGTWSGHGTIVFSAGTLYRVPAGGGECKAAALPPAPYVQPILLSDGRRALLSVFGSGVAIADLESGEVRKLLPGARNIVHPVLVGTRLVVYHRGGPGGTIYAQRLDRRGREFAGEPVALVKGVARGAHHAQFTVAGPTLIYQRAGPGGRQWLVDRRGEALDSVTAPGWTFDLGRSRAWAAVAGFGLHLVDLERSTSTVLESDYALHPVFSPGDSLLAYQAGMYTGMCRVMLRRMESGRTTTAYDGRPCFQPSDWTPDGRRLVGTLAATDSAAARRIGLLDIRTGELEPILSVVGNAAEGVVSRDGRWLAYSSDEGGRPEVFVRPFLRPGAAIRVSREGGRTPRWRGDGRELYFASPRGDVIMVAIGAGATLQDAAPVRLFVGGWQPFAGLGGGPIFTVNEAGTRFLLSRPAEEAAARLPLVLVHGWNRLLDGSGR